jgi:ubiquitin C-terminal hydrolase
MFAGELPHEVVVSIQRVLEVQSTEEADRLDGLSERFNAVEILNDFFPDGVYLIPCTYFQGVVLNISRRGFACSYRCCQLQAFGDAGRTAEGN